MSLAALFADLEQDINNRLPGLVYKVGSRFLEGEDGGNRIVFVPGTETFQPAQQYRGQTTNRIIRIRLASFSIQLWGVPSMEDGTKETRKNTAAADYDSVRQTERMLAAVLGSLEDVAHSFQYELTGGDWMNTVGADVMQNGVQYLLSAQVKFGVAYMPRLTATVTAGVLTGTLEQPLP